MKPFRWSTDKNETLKAERDISFEEIVLAIEEGGLKDLLVHPNQRRYPGQIVLVVAYRDYVYLVPSVEESTHYVLKTVIPTREGGARIALGKTRGGRFLCVNYVPDPAPESMFVITAYQLGPKALRALRRRRKRRR